MWFDAVIGYLSASIEWARRSGDPDAWRAWWNDPEALSYYFIGKANITFHSQIWPAELLAYAGKGTHGGTEDTYGALNLPTEVVSSEFLTMEGKKFSSSQRGVIYVRDLLSRYQPDAFRFFVASARPEAQDSDFTWSEFVRRTNDELVAGWGNLVNRTATLIAKNFREIPEASPLTTDDERVLAVSEQAFTVVGDLIGRHRQKQAIGEAMRAVAEVNKYVTDSAPWALKGDEERERLGTVLHVIAQCVSDLNLVLAPFLPFSANAVDAIFGGAGDIAPMRASTRSTTSTAVPATRSSPATTPLRPPGNDVRWPSARRSTSRPRSSPSWTFKQLKTSWESTWKPLTAQTRTKYTSTSPA